MQEIAVQDYALTTPVCDGRISSQHFQTALALATALVAQRRAQAPAGFDPQAVAAEPPAETDTAARAGSESALSPNLYNEVLKRMGAEGTMLKPLPMEEPVGRGSDEPSTRVESAPGEEGNAELGTENEKQTETPESRIPNPESVSVEFSPEQEEAVKIKLTEATTAATAALQTKLTEAEQQIATLNETVEKAGAEPAPVTGRVHPLMLAMSAAPIDQYHQEFLKTERWANKHWDGYNEESPDWKPGHTALTGAQVREYFTQEKQTHDAIVPAALRKVENLEAGLDAAKARFPNLFVKGHEDQKAALQYLRTHGELLTNPNVFLDLGDMIAGRKARLAKEKAEQDAKAGGTSSTSPQSTPKPGTQSGTRGARPSTTAPAPGARSALTPRTTATASNPFQDKIALNKLMEQRGSADALKKMLTGYVSRN